MTFELSPEHLRARDAARAFAQSLRDRAAEFDRSATIPSDVVLEHASATGDALAMTVAVEEVAAVSAAAAINVAAGSKPAGSLGLMGLRGARKLEDSPRSQLVLAAVALGIGRSAVDAALAEVRLSTATPRADVEKPHWVVADAATELEAARLLTYKAAQTMADADVALARLTAAGAAQMAVNAALRIAGAAALEEGNLLERLSRDVRAVALVSGTEENQRAVAAEGLLPH